MPNKHPHTSVLTPVLAPALIPAADSGEINMGGPEKYPDRTVVSPKGTEEGSVKVEGEG